MKTVIRFSSLGLLATVCLFSSPTLDGADCNQNGIDDAMDLLPGDFNVLAAPRYRYPVGHVPGGVVAADFNGDGRPDLATADRGCAPCGPNRPSSVSVLLNRGDRTFEEAVSYPAVGAGGWVYELLVAADLDGDGSEDLATATGGVPGFVSVFLNRGDGTFDVAVSYLVGEGPRSLIAADFSGDGQLDLVTADKAHNGLDAISVLLNLGGGTFAEAVRYPVAGGVGPLVTADLDGDGSADLATVSMWCPQPEPPVVSVLRNRGEGVFEDAVSYPVAAGAELLITADLDGDGSPDLATALAAGGCFDDDPWAPSLDSHVRFWP
ncbi:MAG: VCBS repeat-containing protein [Candidatus Eisenbacteria bacterium]|nr:VCBS repeat-containing protein [Candidatus Eisenbacteria bacterium]